MDDDLIRELAQPRRQDSPPTPDVWSEIRQQSRTHQNVIDVGHYAIRRAKTWLKRLSRRTRPRNDSNYGTYRNVQTSAAETSKQLFIAGGNEDYFYSTMYWYFEERGLNCIILSRIMNVLTLTFIIGFSVFLLAVVDWTSLLQCHDEASCMELGSYLRKPTELHGTAWLAAVALYGIVFGAYWIWSVLSIIPTYLAGRGMHQFYTRHLGITERQLKTLEWHQVIDAWERLLCTARLIQAAHAKRDTLMNGENGHMSGEMAALNYLDMNNLISDAAAALQVAKATGTQPRAPSGLGFDLPVPAAWLMQPALDPWASMHANDANEATSVGLGREQLAASIRRLRPRMPTATADELTPPPTTEDAIQAQGKLELSTLSHAHAKPIHTHQNSSKDFTYVNRNSDFAPERPPRIRRPNSDTKNVETDGLMYHEVEPTDISRASAGAGEGHSLQTAHYIACRLMRRENYLVAMFNQKVLDTRLPFAFPVPIMCASRRIQRKVRSRLGGTYHTASWLRRNIIWYRARLPFTRVLEWSVQLVLLSQLFTDKFTLRTSSITNPSKFSTRLRVLGLIELALVPFALPFLLVYFAVKHVEDVQTGKSKGNYFGPRTWSHGALWKMREFNEVPHLFRRRLYAALPHANVYIRQFPSPGAAAVGRAISFIAGAVLAVLLLISLIDDSLALYVTIHGRNLLWYIAIASAVLALGRGITPAPEDTVHHPNGAMAKLVPYTHYFPKNWEGRCGTFDVRDEFLKLYPYRAKLFAQELLSVLFVPLLLLFTLPRKAADILHFIETTTVHLPGLGAVCRYSLFDPGQEEQNGAEADIQNSQASEHATAPVTAAGSESMHLMQPQSVSHPLELSDSDSDEEALDDEDILDDTVHSTSPTSPLRSVHNSPRVPLARRQYAKNAKLQTSLLSFAANYPGWGNNMPSTGATNGNDDSIGISIRKSANHSNHFTSQDAQNGMFGTEHESGYWPRRRAHADLRSTNSPISVRSPPEAPPRPTRAHTELQMSSLTGLDMTNAMMHTETQLMRNFLVHRPRVAVNAVPVPPGMSRQISASTQETSLDTDDDDEHESTDNGMAHFVLPVSEQFSTFARGSQYPPRPHHSQSQRWRTYGSFDDNIP